ncbi:MAG: DNA-3-methyladenine glycosylase [Methanocellales archaeon]
MTILSRKFYLKDPALVAKNLLSKVLVRKINSKLLVGKIVETEAYYGEKDPASRAYRGMKNFNKPMWGEAGRAFIYMVHANWLFNAVAHPENEAGAVLIRALEPLNGVEEMKKYRKVSDLTELTSGPGKLTKAMKITEELNGTDLTNIESEIFICHWKAEEAKIRSSYRIGVSRDLPLKLRFYLESNPYVSRKT